MNSKINSTLEEEGYLSYSTDNLELTTFSNDVTMTSSATSIDNLLYSDTAATTTQPEWSALHPTTTPHSVERHFNHTILATAIPPGHHHNHYHRSTVLLVLVAFIVVAVLCNLFTCLVVKLDQRLHHMTYYLCMSLAVLHVIVSCTVMPASLAVFIADEFTYSEMYCKLWVTLDLFFCNNSCLHLAFANMDTYLRLKDPLRHGRIITWCSLAMWTSASWIISFVQGIAQFMLSQAESHNTPDDVCFIGDKNFLILGTIFSYLIPNIISIGFYIMCYREIKVIRLGRYIDENGTIRQQYQYGSENSFTDEEECSDGSRESDNKAETFPAEIYPLSVVSNNNPSFSNCLRVADEDQVDEDQLDNGRDEVANIAGTLNLAFNTSEANPAPACTDSCTLMLRDTTSPNNARSQHSNGMIADQVSMSEVSTGESMHECPDECLRHEIVLNRLIGTLLFVVIIFWAPMSFGNFVLGLCIHCQRALTNETLFILKWIGYSVTWLAPMLYIRFSGYIRSAGYKLCTCHFCQ